MLKYVVARGSRTADAETLHGWMVHVNSGRKLATAASIVFSTKMEAEVEANRLSIAEAKRVKTLEA